MQMLDFVPPDENGKFFIAPQTEGASRFFHGTSTHFSARIEEHGFLLKYRLVTENQLNVLSRYAIQMQNVGPQSVWSLGASKRLSLTRHSTLALQYASGGLKGGIYKSLLGDVAAILEDPSKLRTDDALILQDLKAEVESLSTEPGIVYAIDLDASEVARLDPPGGIDPTYAPFDILPERVVYAMEVPKGYEYR